MIDTTDIFYGILGGTFDVASSDERLAMIEYLLPVLKRWNISWGNGTIDMYSHTINKILCFKESTVLILFGKGAKTVSGKYTKKACTFYSIHADEAIKLNLPQPDVIVERVTGRQYYLYIINF